MKAEMTLKELYQESVVNLISAQKYVNLSFYGFILSKCRIEYDEKFPTLGVTFQDNTFLLVIGGKFREWTLDERIAVLIHETKHIFGLHMFECRKGNRDHDLFNVAADIAINQTIVNLPEGGVTFENFDFPKNKSAETYYELLKQEKEKQEKEKEQKEENGEPWEGPEDGHPDLTNMDEELTIDVHMDSEDGSDTPGEAQELAKSIAESMVKDAVSQTRGDLPGDIENILQFLKRKPKISWKRELKKILSSRSGSKISTIKRKDKRFSNRNDLRGRKTHKDLPEIVVGIDTSGSMEDSDVLNGLTEIYEIMKNIGKVKVIQIDTEIKKVEILDKNNLKSFTRRGYGGTYLGVLPKFLKENKETCDALIMITDMWIEDVKTDENWLSFKKPVLWLNTSGTSMKVLKHHRVFDIHNV